MEAYILDWLDLSVRWLHFVAGIAWIGSSFYFIWLDNHLVAPSRPTDDIAGEVWSVHGGGFYRAEKYRLAPSALPEPLHWFKWEAYTTWLSGVALLALVYWYGASVYLIDPAVLPMSRAAAVVLSIAFIAGGFAVYELLCRSPLRSNERVLALVLAVLVAALAIALCHVFSGRGAYLHFGAVLGTLMVANVFVVIIPGQKRLVAAAARGLTPDPGPGIRAKQRSVHNTYFTLPVLFTMISNHFPMTYAHSLNWLILVAIALAGAAIRAFFVARQRGRPSLLPAAAAILLVLGVAVTVAPRPLAAVGAAADFEAVTAVIDTHCTICHADAPAHPGFAAPPAGVRLDTRQAILAEAARIHEQTVVTRAMPIGNVTGMSDAERSLIDAWYRAGSKDR